MAAVEQFSPEPATARMRRVAEIAARHAGEVDREGRFPRETLSALKQNRLLGLTIPANIYFFFVFSGRRDALRQFILENWEEFRSE